MKTAPSQAEVTIVAMRRRHFRGVLRIEKESNPRPWALAVFAAELAQGDDRYYRVAKLGGRVCGYGGMMFVADEAHVTNIAVAPEQRRRGIASRLLGDLVDEASRRDCGSMTLEVRMGNHGAQELYRKFGFESVGVRPRYYPETGEDGLIMWLFELRSPEVLARARQASGPRP